MSLSLLQTVYPSANGKRDPISLYKQANDEVVLSDKEKKSLSFNDFQRLIKPRTINKK